MAENTYVVIEHLRGQVADISYVMLAAARECCSAAGGEVVAVLLGKDPSGMAKDFDADRVIYVDHASLAEYSPEAYSQALAPIVSEDAPRIVLFGDTSIGAEIAGILSARLDLPAVSACQKLGAENGAPSFVCQILGGKIFAQGLIPEPSAIITMVPGGYKPEQGKGKAAPKVETRDAPALGDLRISLKEYVEPEEGDVDITKEKILVAVGRGVGREDNLELAEELAEALGGAVCGTRPVVDQGWLPTSRLVGKSGKAVKPSVYLTLGISGAPEHTESIMDSELIIAINTDITAPIFEIAQYGANIDMLDLMPVLAEKITAAKGG